jgi:hypothetical protein
LGSRRAEYVCESLQYGSKLDCESLTALCVHALEHSDDVLEARFHVAAAMLVMKSCPLDSKRQRQRWRQRHGNKHSNTDDQMDVHFHECVALISPDGGVSIWDHGKWRLSPGDPTQANSILALKVDAASAIGKGLPKLPSALKYAGHSVTEGQWMSFLPAEQSRGGMQMSNGGITNSTPQVR